MTATIEVAALVATRPAAAPSPSEPLAVALAGVTKLYGRPGRASRPIVALDNVTWALHRGARACLLGPNGAGKSTSIRLLEGALQPTAGRVILLGAPTNSASFIEARRRTGIVPQSPGMFRDLSVGEYLELARSLYGRGDLAVALERFGLERFRGTMLAQLSGGYQRRVSLAAALLAEPELLLLDEPTVGLDPVAAHDVRAALREAMALPGRTTLLCTHNLAEAAELCDEVVILRHGAVLLHAPLAALRQRTEPHLRLAARQGAAPLLAALARRDLPARLADRPDARPGSVLVPVADPEAGAPALLRALLADGLDVYACEPVEATLEELFLDAVAGGA